MASKTNVKITGGDKWASAIKHLGEPIELNVGFINGATYPDGMSVAQVAFQNEYGTSKIPARPFMRYTIQEENSGWGDIVADQLEMGVTPKFAMGILGTVIKGQIIDNIESWQEPPNAPSTIKRKGFNAPLRHTGILKSSITYRVREKKPTEHESDNEST